MTSPSIETAHYLSFKNRRPLINQDDFSAMIEFEEKYPDLFLNYENEDINSYIKDVTEEKSRMQRHYIEMILQSETFNELFKRKEFKNMLKKRGRN